jgi:hypothetical protein
VGTGTASCVGDGDGDAVGRGGGRNPGGGPGGEDRVPGLEKVGREAIVLNPAVGLEAGASREAAREAEEIGPGMPELPAEGYKTCTKSSSLVRNSRSLGDKEDWE